MVHYIEAAISGIIQIYTFMIFGYILLSWVPQLKDSALGYFLARTVEPFLQPFRQLIRPIGMIDISAIVALMTLYLAEKGLLFLIRYFSQGMSI